MAKDPATLFYFDNFLTATSLWDEAEVGQYIRILGYLSINGRLSEKELKKICENRVFEVVKSKLERDDDGLFFNHRMELERHKQQVRKESGKLGSKRRWDSKTDSKAIAKPMANPMAKRMAKRMPSNSYSNTITNTITITQENAREVERLICENFGVKGKGVKATNKAMQVSRFVKTLEDSDKGTIEAYFEFKKVTRDKSHYLVNFLDGGWNNEDWAALLEAHKKQNGEAEPVDWEKI